MPLWLQVETGNPFMLYKDSANRKSNQQNLGTIKSSNLCTGGLAIHANFLINECPHLRLLLVPICLNYSFICFVPCVSCRNH